NIVGKFVEGGTGLATHEKHDVCIHSLLDLVVRRCLSGRRSAECDGQGQCKKRKRYSRHHTLPRATATTPECYRYARRVKSQCHDCDSLRQAAFRSDRTVRDKSRWTRMAS